MFDISKIDLSNGLNGFETMIMNSSEKADNVINDFEKVFMAGLNPNDVLDQVISNRHYNYSDFTSTDANRIKRKVEAIYKSTMGTNNY